MERGREILEEGRYQNVKRRLARIKGGRCRKEECTVY
jgi:hypothetical protein